MAVTTLEQQISDLGGMTDEAWLDTGLVDRPGQPVRILVRRRHGRYDMSDGAAALELSGRPQGWLTTMEQVVAQHSMNVNRRGVVFVAGFPGEISARS